MVRIRVRVSPMSLRVSCRRLSMSVRVGVSVICLTLTLTRTCPFVASSSFPSFSEASAAAADFASKRHNCELIAK